MGNINKMEADMLLNKFNHTYGLIEKTLTSLFKNKEDFSIETIYARAAFLDRFYSTCLNTFGKRNDSNKKEKKRLSNPSIEDVARYISLHQSDIKKAFEDKDPYKAVKEIMKVSFSEKGVKIFKNIYVFATKYCSFMYPNKYPIYDSLIGTALKELNSSYTGFDMSPISLEDLDKQNGYEKL